MVVLLHLYSLERTDLTLLANELGILAIDIEVAAAADKGRV